MTERSVPRLEHSERWVRARFEGIFVADSRHPVLLWEPPRSVPLYYFPRGDVRTELLTASEHVRTSDSLGEATYWDLAVGGRRAANTAWAYPGATVNGVDLGGYIAFKWDMMDAWFEEDDEVFVHPRDPHTRVDILNSTRHVRVEVGGVTIADTHRPRLLFETGLPVRYYIPKLDVRMDLMTPSATVTRCPYKGQAAHLHLDVAGRHVDDVAWTYVTPLLEAARIENMVAFYPQRVDAIYVDGELTG